jgi:hypothetical protein
MKKLVDMRAERRGETVEDAEIGSGSLFATGLVAGGALAGVIVALLSIPPQIYEHLQRVSFEEQLNRFLTADGYQLLGVSFFAAMAGTLYFIATKPAAANKAPQNAPTGADGTS